MRPERHIVYGVAAILDRMISNWDFQEGTEEYSQIMKSTYAIDH